MLTYLTAYARSLGRALLAIAATIQPHRPGPVDEAYADARALTAAAALTPDLDDLPDDCGCEDCADMPEHPDLPEAPADLVAQLVEETEAHLAAGWDGGRDA